MLWKGIRAIRTSCFVPCFLCGWSDLSLQKRIYGVRQKVQIRLFVGYIVDDYCKFLRLATDIRFGGAICLPDCFLFMGHLCDKR